MSVVRMLPLRKLLEESQNGLSKRRGDGNAVPVLRLADIAAGQLDESDPREINLTEKEFAKYRLLHGDLVCIRVNGSKALVGRVIPFKSARSWAYCDHFIRFRPKHDVVDFRYLTHFFSTRPVRRHVELNMVSSAGQNTVSQGTMLDIQVPVPSLDEQHRIVAEIEKQFSRLDEAVANLRRVKANLKRYKAAILKAAVEGRLVETEASVALREGRGYETGEQLLQRLLEVRRARPRGRSKYKEPATPNLDAVTNLPEGWTWASVEQVVAHLTDGDHQAPPQSDSGVPFLVIGNVRTGEIDLTDTRFVGEDYYNALDSYRQPVRGDLLYTLVGSYGIPVRVKTAERFCIQRHMAILRPHSESPMDYLTIAMASDSVFKQATEVSTGTAQLTVPLSGLRSIAIGLPPNAEQVRIVAEVDRHLSNIREVEAEVDAASQRAKSLRHAILSNAFKQVIGSECEIHLSTKQSHRCNGC